MLSEAKRRSGANDGRQFPAQRAGRDPPRNRQCGCATKRTARRRAAETDRRRDRAGAGRRVAGLGAAPAPRRAGVLLVVVGAGGRGGARVVLLRTVSSLRSPGATP